MTAVPRGTWLLPPRSFPKVDCPLRRAEVERRLERLLPTVERAVMGTAAKLRNVDVEAIRSLALDAAWAAAASWKPELGARLEACFSRTFQRATADLFRVQFGRRWGCRKDDQAAEPARTFGAEALDDVGDESGEPSQRLAYVDLVECWLQQVPTKYRRVARALAFGASRKEAAAVGRVSVGTVFIMLRERLRPSAEAFLAGRRRDD